MKKVLALALGLVFCLGLTACSDDEPMEKKIKGTWEVYMRVNTEYWGHGSTFTFAKDGTCTIYVAGDPHTLEGTYTVDGDKLDIQLTTVDPVKDEVIYNNSMVGTWTIHEGLLSFSYVSRQYDELTESWVAQRELVILKKIKK